jgi:hypothetical protein
MENILSRIFENLIGRVTGPMMFRLILQPAMATLMAIRDGCRDAKAGRTPYFWTVVGDPVQRRQLLLDGWRSVMKVFSLAFVLDLVYQWIALRWLYPGEAALVAVILAIVPYVLVRGPVDRLARISSGLARGTTRT